MGGHSGLEGVGRAHSLHPRLKSSRSKVCLDLNTTLVAPGTLGGDFQPNIPRACCSEHHPKMKSLAQKVEALCPRVGRRGIHHVLIVHVCRRLYMDSVSKAFQELSKEGIIIPILERRKLRS